MRLTLWLSVALVSLASGALSADDSLSFDSLESELPNPLGNEDFDELRGNSPFLRVLEFSSLYSLRAVAEVEGESVAWLLNLKTKETVTVWEFESNALGMILKSITRDMDSLEGVSVVINFTGEDIELIYDSSQISPQPRPVEYDKNGKAKPPQELVDKYRSLDRDQMRKYLEWRKALIAKDPNMDKSPKRFPLIDKAIDAIKRGQSPRPP
tara:strand:- start:2565 stop:3197 length:633 start_codon:yes stop_codon:yes gene_type:complete